jgi:DNA repair protein RadA/Sms
MAKEKKKFICQECGSTHGKWAGKCQTCNEWNSIVELKKSNNKKIDSNIVPLNSIEIKKELRIKTGIKEFNLVCGGGIVPGSVILIGGEPGIGKSTLSLQIAHYLTTLYISGEESPIQLRMRAERLEIDINKIKVSTTTIVENIIDLTLKEKPECLIIDSIQTLSSSENQGTSGSVSQIRESTIKLTEMAKANNIPIIIVGHINKDGNIAGPKILEHIVDTVLYFEGDFAKDFRILRAFKNRFGSINEVGLFRMDKKGLHGVKDKNTIFVNQFESDSPGNAVAASLEGSRIILFEVQSLVAFSNFPNPRRMADGLDLNRLLIIVAVLEKHCNLNLSTYDIFINVSGGYQINETSSDLAVAIAIASSLKGITIPHTTGFIGEISLSGEIRPVAQILRRVNEFKNSGYKKIFTPKIDMVNEADSNFSGEIVQVSHISEVINNILKN